MVVHVAAMAEYRQALSQTLDLVLNMAVRIDVLLGEDLLGVASAHDPFLCLTHEDELRSLRHRVDRATTWNPGRQHTRIKNLAIGFHASGRHFVRPCRHVAGAVSSVVGG